MSSLRREIPLLLAVATVSACATRHGAHASSDAGEPSQGGFLTGIASQGCPDATLVAAPSPGPDAARCAPGAHISFANDVMPVLHGCSGEFCHDGTWGSPDAYRYLVNVRADECCDGRLRVDPGDPGGSYLVQKLRGIELCAGHKMPLEGLVTDAQMATIEAWICQGAQDD